MTITLWDGPYRSFLLVADSGASRLVQWDWDFPLVAAAFGWEPCSCGSTDGTIDCDHRTVKEMIWDGYKYLASRVGESIQDPGYF